MNASSAESLNDYQNNEMRLQEPQTQQQQQSPNNNTNTTDDDCCSSSWKQWTLQQLDRLNRLVSEIKKNDDDNDDEHSRQQQQQQQQRRLAITTGLGVTLLSCLLGYRRHRMRRMTQNSKNNNNYRSAKTAPVSLLFQAAKEGRIQTALLQNSSTNGGGVFYKLVDGIWRQSILPSSSYYTQKELLETLLVHCSDVSVLPEPLLQQLATPLLAALPFVYLAVMYKLMKNIMISNGSGGEDIQKTLHSHSTTSFDDVAGMDDAKQDVAELVQYLKNPQAYMAVGARPPRGILLYGPPGTGKTLLARAVAGESNVDCFLACSASEFVEMYVGRGAARVRALFQQARREALLRRLLWWEKMLPMSLLLLVRNNNSSHKSSRKASAILFIDELDALAKSRVSVNSNDEREQTLNQLLVELDGFRKDDNVTLVVIAASNRADVLDPAILRRFDRQVHVGYPDARGREEILKVHARHIHCGTDIAWNRIASDAMTSRFSGADIRNLINEAALLAVRERSATVNQNHLEHAARRISRSGHTSR